MISKKIAIACIAFLTNLSVAGAPLAANTVQCSLKRIAELPVKSEKGQLLIQVQVNGQNLWMDVNPATPVSLISSRAAAQLKLSLRDITGAIVLGGDGKHVQHFTRASTLTLAGMTAKNVTFLVMPSSPVAPGDNPEEEAEGSLGAEFLAGFDIDFDLPHGKITLFSQDHCPGEVVYWTQDYVAIPFRTDDNNHIWFPTKLDGHEFRTLFDTSSIYTTLSTQAAKSAFNLDPAGDHQAPDGFAEKGTSGETPYYHHHFDSFDIDGVTFHNTDMMIIRDRQHREAQNFEGIVDAPLKLGLRHLAKLRIYVAYGEKMLYVSAADAK